MKWYRPKFRPRMPEGFRWLRSDGTPNFTNRVFRRPSELEVLARRPVVTVTPTMPIGLVSSVMHNSRRRALPVVDAEGRIKGIVTATDLVNYLGGGEYFGLVENRHKRNIYWALGEPVSSIMTVNPITVRVEDSLAHAVELMIRHNVGALPVLFGDDRVYGIVTEMDVVKHISERDTGINVSEVMSSNVITASEEEKLVDAMRRMIAYGFRRLPVVRRSVVTGMITTLDVVSFFGSNRVFSYVSRGLIDEVLEVPVGEVCIRSLYTISPDADVGDAASRMIEADVSSLLVVENGRLKGIVTSRDLLLAFAIRR